MKIRLAKEKIEQGSIVDGEGIRAVIWTQGCAHNCKGCHNPETHSFSSGYLVDIEEVKEEIASLSIEDGITFTGGDPIYQIEAVTEIAKYAKSLGLNIWCYTGFTFEELIKNDKCIEFLKYVDILVDGEFILEQKSLNLHFRGSKNQRIINVKRSLKEKKACKVAKYKDERKITVMNEKMSNNYLFI